MRVAIGLLALSSLAATGCTHNQLRRSTVGQANIVADIYQQQVLDNLAKFVRDPNSLPSFSVPKDGFTTVTDNAQASGGLSWNATRFAGAMLGGNGSRQVQENYALIPVSDPRKLELIRCAFQQAVRGCSTGECPSCPDCQKRFSKFYTGSTDEPVSGVTATGVVTSDCLQSCWFHVGCADCARKLQRSNPCCLVGINCETAVWVCPGKGTSELAKLTIAILDYAKNDPPPKRTRTVVAYRDALNRPATKDSASYVVSAELEVDKEVEILLHGIGTREEQLLLNQGLPQGETIDGPFLKRFNLEPGDIKTFESFPSINSLPLAPDDRFRMDDRSRSSSEERSQVGETLEAFQRFGNP